MARLQHSIRTVARLTGLSPHVIRVWERRYKAVEPERTDTNRRVYTDEDVNRLELLKRATLAGYSISHIAGLPTEGLLQIAREAPASAEPGTGSPSAPAELIDESLLAIRAMNASRLEELLHRAVLMLGQHGALERVVGPLAREIGELWQNGTIMAAHEHFASNVIRGFLQKHSKPFVASGQGPTVIVGTPSGQLHELGAVIAAAAAADMGWGVIYLGPSLPAAEIAAAAIQNRAKVVALSIVYPEDDPYLPQELENLRRYLPAQVEIIAGGRGVSGYSGVLEKIKALQITDLKEFYTALERTRRDRDA